VVHKVDPQGNVALALMQVENEVPGALGLAFGAVGSAMRGLEGLAAGSRTIKAAETFSMTSRQIQDVGTQLMVEEFTGAGGEIIADEITYEAELADGSVVRGRADVLGQHPDLPDDHFLYLEAKAGLNPVCTPPQLKLIQADTFVPVRFVGEKASRYGLDLSRRYLLKIEVFEYPFIANP
jgi:hypothetical protein